MMFIIDIEEKFNKPNTALRVTVAAVGKRLSAGGEQKTEITESMTKYALEQALGALNKGHSMKYELKQTVTIAASGEQGEVISRAEYAYSEPAYLLRYKSADGRAVELWWGESALI